MKYFFVLFIFWSNFAFAAVTSSGVVWEMRQTATANNVNGCGYNPANATPGSDYSLQDTSQYTFSDLASTNGTTNPCVVSSASHVFTSSDPGNIMFINNGTNWTATRREIVSVSGGNATLDGACGSSATLSSGTYHVGGACSLQASTDSTFFSHWTAGNVGWVKAGTYTQGANSWTSMPACTYPLPCALLGYNTTRGDYPVGDNRPYFSASNGVISLNSYWTIANVRAYSTNGGSNGVINGGNSPSSIINCKLVQASLTGSVPASNTSSNTQYINDEFISYNGWGIQIAANASISVINSYFHDSQYGIYQAYGGGAQPIISVNNVFENLIGGGIFVADATTATGNYTIVNNTFYGGESTKIGVGVRLGGTTTRASIFNNLFYGLATGIFNNTTPNGDLINFNDFYNNTADVSGVTKGSSDVAINPSFKSVGQYAGTTATSSGTTLTDSGANFANVVNNRDYVILTSGTGVTVSGYGITGHTTTTLTTDATLGTHAAGDIHYSIIYGHDLTPTAASLTQGTAGFTSANINLTNYQPIGAITPQYTDPTISKVKNGTSYIFSGASETGSLVSGFPKRPGGHK